ncbi:MAG: 2,3-bisphosphoglycerate-independent phosphoglycerate mutase [Pseudomonadota bacterium]
MTSRFSARPVVLCILDGWGYREQSDSNAILQAATPHYDRVCATTPRALIDASETAVGLPSGQMGNSEVGHMNIGAGRVVMQDLPRIDQAMSDGSFQNNPVLQGFMEKVKGSGGVMHVMGLMSPGGVHSHQDQIAVLANVLVDHGLPVKIHAFLDGRDTPPQSADDYLQSFQAAAPDAEIATVVGRYFAMDRDQRWERVIKAYDLLVRGQGHQVKSALEAVEQAYARGQTDEFVEASAVAGYAGMTDGDGLIMANFRADRAREILQALLDPAFDAFERQARPSFVGAAGMVEYATQLNPFVEALYPPLDLEDTLGQVIATHGLKQLRLAETEKYAHVTFFLNGGREDPFSGEDRILVPSPKVATYDLQPEMSAPEVTDKLVEAILSGTYDLIVCNYANGDMVGHSGQFEAAVQAVETLDSCLGKVCDAIAQSEGTLLLTADHGNVEQMLDPETGQSHTAHTMNPVPIHLINGPDAVSGLRNGRLADIAPTILALMGIDQPEAMTGERLLVTDSTQQAAQ